jgi:hypothetical protein
MSGIQHTFSEALTYVRDAGVMVGDGQGNLRPDDLATRRELVTMVMRQMGNAQDFEDCFEWLAPSLPVRYTKLFADVSLTDPMAEQFCGAMVLGLIDGRRDASFGPGEPVTMAEAAKVLSRAYGIYQPGRDDPSTMPWHVRYTDPLAQYQAIAHTVVRPNQRLTRAEVAVMFYQLRNLRPAIAIDTKHAADLIERANAAGVPTTDDVPAPNWLSTQPDEDFLRWDAPAARPTREQIQGMVELQPLPTPVVRPAVQTEDEAPLWFGTLPTEEPQNDIPVPTWLGVNTDPDALRWDPPAPRPTRRQIQEMVQQEMLQNEMNK